MRILVLGHSDSSGVNLARREDAWPQVVAARLAAEIGAPVDIDHRELSPIRPGTAEFVAGLTQDPAADVVCLAVNPFWFAGSTVRVKVQRRWGPKSRHESDGAPAHHSRRDPRIGDQPRLSPEYPRDR